ncbi:MAG TPA: hypothetical protein VG734_12390 [Lacunisphaera sp.]|nr:hypothetical protein [Lacunisphaera sp.]
MSLNRYEQAIFDYWEQQPDERRYWVSKVADMSRAQPGLEAARPLERELWAYLLERQDHVPQLRSLGLQGVSRVSMLNLAEHLLRLWGLSPKAPRSPKLP